MAQTNQICGNPEEWFTTPYFINHGIRSGSFDFFVDWDREQICDEVWIKRISDSASIFQNTTSELLQAILECDGKDYSNQLRRFLCKQGFTEKYMLFRDVPENLWANGSEKVVEIDMMNHEEDSPRHYDVHEIQKRIKQLRKKPASIGKAGLIYSTSSLEGYLSKQKYFWPGDVDTVLYNAEYECIAVVEFKKHTSRSRIPFEEQRLGNYLNRDILKYKSLALLRDRLQAKLIVIYYPIPAGIDYIIVEEIDGEADSLTAAERTIIDLPKVQNPQLMKNFADRFIEIISSTSLQQSLEAAKK